jgi:hypothetical protein
MLPRALLAPMRMMRVSIPSPVPVSRVPWSLRAAAVWRGVRAVPFGLRAELRTRRAARSLAFSTICWRKSSSSYGLERKLVVEILKAEFITWHILILDTHSTNQAD